MKLWRLAQAIFIIGCNLWLIISMLIEGVYRGAAFLILIWVGTAVVWELIDSYFAPSDSP